MSAKNISVSTLNTIYKINSSTLLVKFIDGQIDESELLPKGLFLDIAYPVKAIHYMSEDDICVIYFDNQAFSTIILDSFQEIQLQETNPKITDLLNLYKDSVKTLDSRSSDFNPSKTFEKFLYLRALQTV